MMSLKSATSRSTLAAVVSGTALLAAGCGTAASSGHPAAAFNGQSSAAATSAPASVPALDAIQFVSATQGWAAGAGRILATTDGGHTWVSQYTGPAAIDQVDFTDAQHGWAVGTGSLLGTTNGGATWAALSDPCGSIRSVHFVTPSLGYAVAGGSQVVTGGGVPAPAVGGELLTTTDGGRHWQAVPGAPGQAQTVCFSSQADGFVGTPGTMWRTTDAGQHWTLAFTEPAPSAAVHPAARDTTVLECAGDTAAWVLFLGSGAALGHAPYLAYDTQNARTMHALFEETYTESAARPQVHAPDGPGSYPGPFSAISPDTAVFVGFDPAAGYGAAPVMTVTGGTQLSKEGNVSGITQAYGLAFVSPATGWVVGTNQQTGEYSIEATANGGHTWTRQYQVR